MLEKSEVTIHHPRHTHLLPNYETFNGKLDEVVSETLKKMHEGIVSHLNETATNTGRLNIFTLFYAQLYKNCQELFSLIRTAIKTQGKCGMVVETL